jgi:glycosyltransferase involved in cell wall biosynthesis
MAATLSAVLCVHNEEERLEACLRRLRFADEIVVLLDRCTDRSEDIARRWADLVITGEFPLEGPRRATAVGAASGDWIIEVDADEEVGFSLACEIRDLIATDPSAAYFQVPIDNYVGDHLIRHGWGGSFGTTSVARLFRSGTKRWGDERVHPTVRFDGRAGQILHSPIRHRLDNDIGDMLHRFERYTALRAADLSVRPRGGVWSNAFRAVRRFYKCYVTRKGYREGDWGVLIALLAALYPLVSVLRSRLESTAGGRTPAFSGAPQPDLRMIAASAAEESDVRASAA